MKLTKMIGTKTFGFAPTLIFGNILISQRDEAELCIKPNAVMDREVKLFR
jgi:hypothetical protein